VSNWLPVAKLKRPGVHRLTSLQAVAHGSDTVQYFQWRKSRGSMEKFHGAVVDHAGHENTRVFRDVTEVGELLAKLDPILGTSVQPEVAVVYDWENGWAIADAKGPRRDKDYLPTCQNHYRQFWSRGVPVDVIDMDCDFSPYRLLITPMLYMVRGGVGERIERFVESGGVFVTTYWSGIADENDLCFTGGFPGPLRKVLGIRTEEIDALYDEDRNRVVPSEGNSLGLVGRYEARDLCDLIHPETAEVLATYGDDFYAGRPALTVNSLGVGRALYIASRNDESFLSDFYGALAKDLNLKRAVETDLPQGVTAQLRTDGERRFVFLLNFKPTPQTVRLGSETFADLLTGHRVE
jgi:beta-galactosidase